MYVTVHKRQTEYYDIILPSTLSVILCLLSGKKQSETIVTFKPKFVARFVPLVPLLLFPPVEAGISNGLGLLGMGAGVGFGICWGCGVGEGVGLFCGNEPLLLKFCRLLAGKFEAPPPL